MVPLELLQGDGLLLDLFDDLGDSPALVAADRSSFHDLYCVSNVASDLIMGLKPFRPNNNLAIQRVLDSSDGSDHDGLFHLVRDDNAFSDLSCVSCFRH